MLTRRLSTVVLAMALGLVLTGCSPSANDADASGVWGNATAGQPYLELEDDGSLSGNDGCNSLFGSWGQDGDTVTFNEVAMTEMGCPDVDIWMTALASGTVSGDTMTVLDEEGTALGTLDRTAAS